MNMPTISHDAASALVPFSLAPAGSTDEHPLQDELIRQLAERARTQRLQQQRLQQQGVQQRTRSLPAAP
ncbi:MAG TPA: hypothetical protein VN969_36230 [Streptosporangiaceae bacterium]|nr:hypothetical protein [Streptosporangiaceae bacterium]